MLRKKLDIFCIKCLKSKYRKPLYNKNRNNNLKKEKEERITEKGKFIATYLPKFKLFYFSLPSVIGVSWLMFIYSNWLLTFYKDSCINEYSKYIDYINNLSFWIFIIFSILGTFYFFFTATKDKGNEAITNNLVASSSPNLLPFFYLGTISLSKILIIMGTNFEFFYFAIWIIPLIVSFSFLYCYGFKPKYNNTVSLIYLIVLTIYTLLVIFWNEVLPYVKIFMEIHQCVGKEIMNYPISAQF